MRINLRAFALPILLVLGLAGLASCGFRSDAPNADTNVSEGAAPAAEDSGEAETPSEADGTDAEGATDDSEADEDARESTSEAEGAGGGEGEATLDLVAAVNGVGLPLSEYQRQAFDTQRYFVERGLDPSTEEGQSELLALRRGVLLDMIHQSLIEQAAAEMRILASDEEVAASLAEYEEALSETLEETDVTEEAVVEMERKAIIGRKFVDQIAADVPTEAPYYHARHVLCDERGPCEAALTRLEASEDFATVAAELSVDETTAERGGDLDWIPRVEGINVLPSSELEAALFALEPGQRSGVLESDFGFHVVELIEIDEARALDEELSFQLRQRRVEGWLADAVRRADIVIYVDDLQDVIAAR